MTQEGKVAGIQIHHTKNSTDLFNRRHQLVTLSSSSSPKTVSFSTSHNIRNDAARYRKDCKLECYNGICIALHMKPAEHGPHQPLHLLEIVYGLFQLKYVTLIFTIHNMFDWIYTKTELKLTKY